MNDHDLFESLAKSRELASRISPKFGELTFDLQEVFEKCKDPLFIAALLFKVAEEREASNKLLKSVDDKFDKLMMELKKQGSTQEFDENKTKFEVLPTQDQRILSLIEEKGLATATDIQKELKYKGLNAACHRLNSLYKQGYLKKVQSGKKVSYLTVQNKPL